MPIAEQQQTFLPKRVSTKYSRLVNGGSIAFVCEVAEGGTYYCKQDNDNHRVRFSDRFCTDLASHLGINTAEHAIVEDLDGETYFGSLQHASTSSDFDLNSFLMSPQVDEIGAPWPWPGQHLAKIAAFDLAIFNPDRDYRNFVLRREGGRLTLAAIDFGAARLDKLPTLEFPVAPARTILVGRRLQILHGRSEATAIEMVDRMEAVPISAIQRILSGIPDDWTDAAQKEKVCDAWSSSHFRSRLAALRAGIKDGSLL